MIISIFLESLSLGHSVLFLECTADFYLLLLILDFGFILILEFGIVCLVIGCIILV